MPVVRFAEADALWFAGVNRLFCEEANVRVAVAFGWLGFRNWELGEKLKKREPREGQKKASSK